MLIKATKNGREIDVSLVGKNGYRTKVRVVCICDKCGKEKIVGVDSLIRYNALEKQYCLSCTIEKNNSVELRKKTCLDKYGVDNPQKVVKFKNKAKESHKLSGTYDTQRYDFEFVKQKFLDRKYQLLSKKYKNRTEKLEFICPEGHKNSIRFGDFLKGHGCRDCAFKKISKDKKYKYNIVNSLFEKEGYKLLTKEYKNNKQKLKCICPNGHIWFIRLDGWLSGARCLKCFQSNLVSTAEIEIYNLIKPKFNDILQNNRTIIHPLELDIVIPSQKIAIEYCGIYWHSELMGKSRNYHLDKLDKCNKRGYNLITIFEDEWINKKDIVKSRLLEILNISDAEKIYGRSCKIKEIDTKTKNEFLDKNHLQGRDNSVVKLGAFYKDKLVSVMTFSKGSIAKGNKAEDDIWELNRFCSDYNCRVIGIASRLFKYFRKTYQPKEIFSYSDRRWSIGNLYEVLGFKLSHHSDPNYWYLSDGAMNRTHRFNFRKNVLKDKLNTFDSNLSEWQNMINNGYNRIFDCGNTKWIWQ